jgi:uncharacterized protein YqiB (DUF1249 family)
MKTAQTIHHRIYTYLAKLVPDVCTMQPGDALKSHSSGFMDLNLDILDRNDEVMIIALSHYYKSSCGDMIADPDMEARVCFATQSVEALTYQDAMIYQRVYVDNNKCCPKLKKSLNTFLCQWLKSCLTKGHLLTPERSGAAWNEEEPGCFHISF